MNDTVVEQLKYIGFDNLCEIDVDKIPFEPSLIELCKMNSCGNYGKCWTCPPYVGDTHELIKKAKEYKKAFVFQRVYKIEDSFDIDGMNEANRNFNGLTDRVMELIKNNSDKYLLLGAGGCRICERCAVCDNEPCRFPDKTYASLESYSIEVSTLAKICGIKYINGQNTVTYFGALLIK